MEILRDQNITHVVNCTSGPSALPCYFQKGGEISYHVFPISYWTQYCDKSDGSILAFAAPLFAFIDEALAAGGRYSLYVTVHQHINIKSRVH